jgi:tetratricopeptide (TPR) repeat protein
MAVCAFVVRHYLIELDQTALARASRDAHIDDMLEKLSRDPRVRRPGTQRVVEIVARFSQEHSLETAETQYALGLRRYYGESDFDGAEEAYERAIALKPGWSWPFNGLAIIYFSTGREEKANEAWGEAMRLDPKWSRPHSDMAILYRWANRMDDAVVEVEKALALDPDGAITNYNYAYILDVLGKHAEAKVVYERVIQLDPTLPWPYYNLACGFARQGNVDEAMALLLKSIELDETFRLEAWDDPDFDGIRDSEEFRGAVVVPSDIDAGE